MTPKNYSCDILLFVSHRERKLPLNSEMNAFRILPLFSCNSRINQFGVPEPANGLVDQL
jgi:hypothetical protein